MKFIDTTFMIDIVKGNPNSEPILDMLDREGIHATSSINAHEFLLGAYIIPSDKELEVRKKLLSKFIILDFDFKCAEIAAKIESELVKKGKPIGRADIMIASVMKSNGILEVVTRNVKHFENIEGISILSYEK